MLAAFPIREEPQPDVERHLWTCYVFLDAADHAKKRLLKNVVGGDPACHLVVQVDVNRPPEPVAVQGEQLAEGLLVPVPKLIQK